MFDAKTVQTRRAGPGNGSDGWSAVTIRNIVSGVFAPVLAKRSKHFSLIDAGCVEAGRLVRGRIGANTGDWPGVPTIKIISYLNNNLRANPMPFLLRRLSAQRGCHSSPRLGIASGCQTPKQCVNIPTTSAVRALARNWTLWVHAKHRCAP